MYIQCHVNEKLKVLYIHIFELFNLCGRDTQSSRLEDHSYSGLGESKENHCEIPLVNW